MLVGEICIHCIRLQHLLRHRPAAAAHVLGGISIVSVASSAWNRSHICTRIDTSTYPRRSASFLKASLLPADPSCAVCDHAALTNFPKATGPSTRDISLFPRNTHVTRKSDSPNRSATARTRGPTSPQPKTSLQHDTGADNPNLLYPRECANAVPLPAHFIVAKHQSANPVVLGFSTVMPRTPLARERATILPVFGSPSPLGLNWQPPSCI